jgi:NAD(P)H-flavin reductase
MKKELDAYAEKYFNIKVFYSVDKSVTADWSGFTGYVSEDKITKSMPE